MFRAQNSQLEAAVAKATDENLTSEPWHLILDVCDQVSASASGPQHAVAALIKRLAHRNANVQLYTLELANALSQNCGPDLHRELASKAFTDALLRLAGDRNTHAQVKQKVLERMEGWKESFRGTPELGIMEQAYGKLRVMQPGLVPPSKPAKRAVDVEERRREEEELQMALALSIKDSQAKSSSQGDENGGGRDDDDDGGEETPQPQPPQGTTAATVSRVRALYDFQKSEETELSFKKGDVIAVLESVYKDWWKGSLRGETGIFPLNYVEKLRDPTREELERDAAMEGEVFGEIKNVEKLLALLSVRGEGGRRGEREEEEIGELYQRTLGVRPKLIELIGKYSQKKDDFTQLNEKFIKARRDYEALLESSMQPQYGQPQQQQQFPVRQRPSQHQMYGQPPYGGPPPQQLNYPPQQQAPPSSAQGYAPQQQPYPPQQSQQHLPIQPQQDSQRFYSPSPSEPPNQQPQPGYNNSPYPPTNNNNNSTGPPPSAIQPQNNGPAPFHFIPGGVQVPPLEQQVPQHQIRRKPSPQASFVSDQVFGGQSSAQTPQAQMFQGQIRPNSIHTLNSGNPQELATGGYESPVENRHSYPPVQVQQQIPPHQVPPPQPPYDGYVQQQQQQQFVPQQPLTDRDALPSRRRTMSFESQPGGASPVSPPAVGGPGPGQGQGQGYGPQGGYVAYQPQQGQGQVSDVGGGVGGGGGGVGDPGDFYR